MPGAPTTKHGFATLADGDFINDFPAVHDANIAALDALIAVAIEDDPRPAPGIFGRFHRAASGLLSFDDGTDWLELSSAQAAAAGATFVGMVVVDAGAGEINTADQEWMRPDGRLINRAIYDDYFARVGHAHNGGVDPGSSQVRLPDYRGRALFGADNMGTAAGAAGRLPNSNRARGQSGGAETHSHSVNNHTHGIGADGDHSHNIGFHAMSIQGFASGTTGRGLADPYGNLFGDTTWQTNGSGNHSHGGATGGATPGTNAPAALPPYAVDNLLVRVR